MLFEWAGLSDQGNIRKKNEDILTCHPDEGFFIIADGMGGHKAGEIAAKRASAHISELIHNHIETFKETRIYSEKQIKQLLHASMISTNQYVYNLGQNNQQYRGMGTTLCCLYIKQKKAYLAHVGDSRIYLLRRKILQQLTEDHSLLNRFKKTPIHKNSNQYRHIITQAIGTTTHIAPDISSMVWHQDDLFFLCTDGLSDYVDYEEIKNILVTSDLDLKARAQILIETAKKNGSLDNITVLLLKVQS